MQKLKQKSRPVRISVVLSPEVDAALAAYSYDSGLSKSAVAALAVAKYLGVKLQKKAA